RRCWKFRRVFAPAPWAFARKQEPRKAWPREGPAGLRVRNLPRFESNAWCYLDSKNELKWNDGNQRGVSVGQAVASVNGRTKSMVWETHIEESAQNFNQPFLRG